MKQGCSFIILHTDVQLLQKGLLSGLPFPKLSLGAFVESQEEGSTPYSLFCFIVSYQFLMSFDFHAVLSTRTLQRILECDNRMLPV